MMLCWTGFFPIIQASSNAAAHQMPEIQGAQHRDQMSLDLTAWVECAATTPVHLQAAGKVVPVATVSLRRE